MMQLSKEDIAAELIRRGVSPDQIAAAGYPQVARQGAAGLIAPRLSAPDEIAARQAYGKDYGMIRDAREALGRAGQVESQLSRFQGLNRQQATGGIQSQSYDGWGEKANPFNWPGMIGNAFERFDPEYQGMSGIASELQGKARPAGSGATSDFEQRLYRQGVPSPEKPGPVNDDIATYMRSTLSEEGDRLAFQEEFLRRNGSLSGAQQAWSRYIKSNPYAQAEGVRFKPNTKRQPWDQYFGVAPPRKPIQSSIKPEGLTPDQRRAAARFKGTQGNSGTASNPSIPANKDQFARLPSGTYFIAPDGSVRIKP